MNFYTLTSKSTFKPNIWLRKTMFLTFFISLLIFSINYVVDPYNITTYNILNIKHKFSRNDRTEKLNFFKTLDKFDNILIGSSRVYSINPKIVSDILGGKTYNFGLGTATVEDHLGTIKYLQRNNKLPKNIIIGVDFYTFNPKVPANKYFLKNKELNFLSYQNYSEDYLSKFFSLDAFRASITTLKHHIKKDAKTPRFSKNGWASSYEDYSKRDPLLDKAKTKKELEENKQPFYSNYQYSRIDPKRKEYYKEIKQICKNNNIKLYLFTTPLHPMLLEDLKNNTNTNRALKEFINFLSSHKHFYNFYEEEEFKNNLKHFHGTTHTSNNAGDIIIQKLLIKH